VAVQLASGRVMLNARTISPRHRRVVLTSKDGATKWSAPRFQQELVEPICFGSLVRHSGKKLLFVNPDNLLKAGLEGAPGQSRDRRNLTIRLSEDDGETWKTQRVIDPGWTAYADLNTSPDGAIYVLYERGEPDPARLRIASLTLVRFPLAWVRAGSRPKP
jgi:sialidase-1